MGASVTINGSEVLELIPNAGCTSMTSWTVDEVYALIFEKLGYESQTDDKNAH